MKVVERFAHRSSSMSFALFAALALRSRSVRTRGTFPRPRGLGWMNVLTLSGASQPAAPFSKEQYSLASHQLAGFSELGHHHRH